jgi:hypothetical protein
MRETIHLVPKALRDKIAAHQKAVAAASKKGEPPPADLVLTDADFGSMSGRVVTLRELGIAEMEKADQYAYRRVSESTVAAEFEAMRQDARMRAMIVAVSEPKVDPRKAREPGTVKPISQSDLEGMGVGDVGDSGMAKGNGRSFAELFTAKDQVILRNWDRRHHSVTQDDVDSILGEAIPMADD